MDIFETINGGEMLMDDEGSVIVRNVDGELESDGDFFCIRREDVAGLINHLQQWYRTGSLKITETKE